MTKEQYMKEIIELMKACSDVPLLDLVHKLLTKGL